MHSPHMSGIVSPPLSNAGSISRVMSPSLSGASSITGSASSSRQNSQIDSPVHSKSSKIFIFKQPLHIFKLSIILLRRYIYNYFPSICDIVYFHFIWIFIDSTASTSSDSSLISPKEVQLKDLQQKISAQVVNHKSWLMNFLLPVNI